MQAFVSSLLRTIQIYPYDCYCETFCLFFSLLSVSIQSSVQREEIKFFFFNTEENVYSNQCLFIRDFYISYD